MALPGLVPTMYRIRPDGTDLHVLNQSSTIVPGPSNGARQRGTEG